MSAFYLLGRVIGRAVRPFVDGVMDGVFGEPDDAPIVRTESRDSAYFVPDDEDIAA